MKSYMLVLLALTAFTALCADVTVLSQSQDALTLEFNLPEYEIAHQKINGATWEHIESDYGAIHAEEGFPEVRVYGEAIAIPVDGDISFQISDLSTTVIRNVNLKPVYKMVVDNEKEDANYVFFQNRQVYESSQPYPVELVKKADSAFAGDRNFVPLQIFPFQYKAASKELVVNTHFIIHVLISGSKGPSVDWQLSENPVDQAGDALFLNNATSKAWRLPKVRDTSYQSPKSGTTQVNEIQLIVDKEGIYKVTYAMLHDFIETMTDSLDVEMAWDINDVDPRYLELRNENGPVPIHFIGESDGDFNQQDYFEFYGDRHYGETKYYDDYTDENVYALYLKDSLGARMAVENGGLIASNPSDYIVPDAYESSVHFEEQLMMDKLGHGWSVTNPNFFREDVWFWRKINAPNLDIIPFQLQYPKDSIIRTASVKACLYGLTYAESVGANQYDHEATVRINAAMVNTQTWVGQTEKIFENANPISNSYLHHGTNNLYISLSGNTLSGDREQVLFDYLEVKYWREYKTDDDKIKFSKPSNRPAGLYQFQVTGFSGSDISVYKIGSSIFNSCQVEPFNLDGVAPWTVTLQDSVASDAIQYYAVTENQKLSPKEFRLNLPSDLKNPGNHANVIIVGNYEFLHSEGTDLLVSTWESANNTIAKVDYQDIFDEFNNGIRSAESLKAFFTYAYNNWGPPQLTHVILLGEGVDDERDNSPSRIYALVPVKKTWTNEHGATASDGWYATIVGNDLVPDIAVARINAFKPEQIMDFANKAYNYRFNPQTSRLWNSHLTLTSGGKITDSDDIFAQQSERLRRKNMPQDYRATRVYTSTQTVSIQYFGGTFDLKDALNSGTQYLHFFGHGGGRIWADYNLFNYNDVATLNNQTYPIVMSMCCYASSFDTNGIASISEALVMQPNKGAITTFGFSGLGYMYQDEVWAQALTEAIFKHDFATIGEAYQFALSRFYAMNTSSTTRYALINAAAMLGDPLIHTLKPVGGIPVSADNYVLAPGDTLLVSAQFPSDVLAARLYIQNGNEVEVNIPYDLPVINGAFNASYVVPTDINPPYLRSIYVAGYSPTNEYIGRSAFGVGRAAAMHHSTIPSSPAWNDSVAFIAKVFSNDDILSVTCKARVDSAGPNTTWVSLPMQPYPEIESAYVTASKIPPQTTGEEIACKYVVTTPTGTYESLTSSYITRGPDMQLGDIQLEATEGGQAIKVLVGNTGDAPSIMTDLSLYTRPVGGTQTLFSTQNILPLEVNQRRWETIPLAGLSQGNIIFTARVNTSNAFPEWDQGTANNTLSLTTNYNYYAVGNEGDIIHSLESNVFCEIPQGLVPSGESSVFYINAMGSLTATNQPDISTIKLLSADTVTSDIQSQAYEIRTLNPALVDSTDTLINNKKFKLSFFYSANDPDTQQQESDNSFKIYRWDATGSKWIHQGGNVDTQANKVVFEVSRQGIYTIYRNNDRIRPSIDVNVQDQEFTVGGYISGKGTISLLLSDANGIDVFDNTIRLYLNGNLIDPQEYVATINLDNVNRIPIKYQLDLGKGDYYMDIDCKDVNGNYNTRDIQFTVNEKFDVVNVANYPNPVLGDGATNDPKNAGRTRFTYVLTDDADEVKIKVFTVAGRLVKTFENLPTGVGYHEYPRTLYGWDCKDDYDYYLANGVYFYKIIASKGSKKIEKTMKMAILK